MRYSRFRSSILLSLTTLFFFFVLTLHTLLWSTAEFEVPEKLVQTSKQPSPAIVPIWQALNQANIYDIKAEQGNRLTKNRSPYITSERIEELYQLIVRNKHISLTNTSTLSPTNSTWNFERFFSQKSKSSTNDTNAQVNTADSAANKPANLATTEQTMNENDRIHLRQFVINSLSKWKGKHQQDKLLSLADLMHDALAQDEPARLNTTWYEYIKTVTNVHVYDTHSPQFQTLMNTLQFGQISEASEMSQGTQIKIILDLSDGFQGLLKPYRVPRNYQTQPDHFYFSDIERHHAEIAAFHVDKLLGFNRVPPVIGRLFNITADIREKATEELAKTFFISPANNTCFRGHCSYYCDTSHAICGKPGDRLEGSIQVLLPRPPEVTWQKITHPYRRSYSATKTTKWENNEHYCYEHVLVDEDYHNRLLLDMMDLAAFDFLIGNLDRHHMMRISSFGGNTGLVHLDNGRSFGRYDTDDLSILAPIRQCCFFRYSTFVRLYSVYRQGLSKSLSSSLKLNEPLNQILIDEHLRAIDRRLEILLLNLDTCIQKYSVKGVMIDDGIN